MIIIELRIGRVPAAAARVETADVEQSRDQQGVRARRWRLGNGTAAAVLATALGGIALGLVPAGESPVAHTVSLAPTTTWPAAGDVTTPADWTTDGWTTDDSGERVYMQTGAAALSVGWDKRFADIVDAATARAMLQVQQEAAQRAWDSGREPDAARTDQVVDAARSGWPAWYQDERSADARMDPQLLSALSRDVSAAPAVSDAGPRPAVARAGSRSSTTSVNSSAESALVATARADAIADAEMNMRASSAMPPPAVAAAITNSTAEASGAAAEATGAAAKSQALAASSEPDSVEQPARFSISREQSANAQGLLQALRERAATGDWAGVQQLRESYAQADGLPDSLALAKWDARIALALGQPDAALAALAPYAAALDDEGARLHAVSLLRTGDATAASGVYRMLLNAHPDDAQLWLGLGMALEASQADSEAIRFAYGQSLQLADDAALRQVAQAHLDAHQA